MTDRQSQRIPAPRSVRARNKQDKRVRIERAARTLFAKRGYEATTTREIAELAGIGVGTLFVYFPEKRDLLFHLFSNDVRGVMADALARVPAGPLVDRVMFVFERFFDYYAIDPALSRVLVKEMAWVTDRDRVANNTLTLELINSLAELVVAAQRTGEVDRLVTPQVATYQFVALYFTAVMGWLGGSIPSRETQLSLLRGGLELMHRGLAPRT